MQNNMYDPNIENTRVVNNLQQNPYINQNNTAAPAENTTVTQTNSSLFNNGDFIKGALLGAAVTFLLTNKNAQNTIFGAIAKGNEFFQAGMEELKERYEDMKAQKEANEEF